MKDIMATLEAVTKTANEVRELLNKSLPPPPAPLGKAEGDEGMEPPMAPEGQEGGEAPAPQGGEGMEPPMAPEGQEGGESVDEFAQEIASMSDEELDMLLQALAGEMEKRQGAQQQVPEQAPPAAAPQAEAPVSSPEMDAMKAENISMRKSIQAMNASIESLKKSLATPAAKPASMNKPTQVLNKSVKEPELLSKSEVIEHLETLRKSGNKAVNVDLMWTANYAKTPEEIKDVYHAAKLKGITIPTK